MADSLQRLAPEFTYLNGVWRPHFHEHLAAADADALRVVQAMPKFNIKYYAPWHKPVGYYIPVRYEAVEGGK